MKRIMGNSYQRLISIADWDKDLELIVNLKAAGYLRALALGLRRGAIAKKYRTSVAIVNCYISQALKKLEGVNRWKKIHRVTDETAHALAMRDLADSELAKKKSVQRRMGRYAFLDELWDVLHTSLDSRAIEILRRRRAGETLNAIGSDASLTRERIRQIVHRSICKIGPLMPLLDIYGEPHVDLRDYARPFNGRNRGGRKINMRGQIRKLSIILRRAIWKKKKLMAKAGAVKRVRINAGGIA